jgi:hypothetical protein
VPGKYLSSSSLRNVQVSSLHECLREILYYKLEQYLIHRTSIKVPISDTTAEMGWAVEIPTLKYISYHLPSWF